MRFLGMVVFLALVVAPLRAQETLVKGSVDIGGYGEVVVQTTPINGQFGVMGGGGGGIIIDHEVSLGIVGHWLTSNLTAPSAPSSRPYLNLGYGGVDAKYSYEADKMVHFTGGVMIGGGAVGYRNDLSRFDGRDWGSFDTERDEFFVTEPSVGVELNVTKWFRLDAGASYRFVSGVDLPGLSNSDIGGPNAHLVFRFGSF